MYLIQQLFSSPKSVIPKTVKEPVWVDPGRHDLHPNISAVVLNHDGTPRCDVLQAQHAGTARQKVSGVVKCMETCIQLRLSVSAQQGRAVRQCTAMRQQDSSKAE